MDRSIQKNSGRQPYHTFENESQSRLENICGPKLLVGFIDAPVYGNRHIVPARYTDAIMAAPLPPRSSATLTLNGCGSSRPGCIRVRYTSTSSREKVNSRNSPLQTLVVEPKAGAPRHDSAVDGTNALSRMPPTSRSTVD